MTDNFFTRNCLQDASIIQAKYRILCGGPERDGKPAARSIRRIESIESRNPFPGESSGRFYKKHATKKKPL